MVAPSGEVRRWWWLALSVAALLLALAGARSRGFVDLWWTAEWGRILLHPGLSASMLMDAQGQSLDPWSWLGALLSWLALSGAGFERMGPVLLQVLAWAALGIALWRLLKVRSGARAALWIAAVALLTPALVQSVLFARVDSLALALIVGGLAIAETAALRASRSWLRNSGLGYTLCCAAPFVWPSATILAFLCAWHGVQQVRAAAARDGDSVFLQALRVGWMPVAGLLILALPLLVRGWSDMWAVVPTMPWSRLHVTLYNAMLASPLSFPLFALAAIAALAPANRGLLWWTVPAVLYAARFGFYDWRLIYLLPYAALLLAQALRVDQWTWMRAVVAPSLLCLIVFFLLHLGWRFTQPPPRAEQSLRTALDERLQGSKGPARIMDLSWDFYAPALRAGHTVLRPWAAIEAAELAPWLRRHRADLVINFARDTWVFRGASGWAPLLTGAGYCRDAGEWLPASTSTTEGDERWGKFPDYGPYETWRPCDAHP